MNKALKVLTVGDNADALSALKDTLTSDELEVAGTAGLGPAALTWAKILEPDIAIVMAEESLARPVAVTQSLAQGNPAWTVVVLAEKFERELVRQAMLVGARDVLVHSTPPAELRLALATARRADLARRGGNETVTAGGTIISLVGVKGGIGKTTTSLNLAVALAEQTSRSVALVDLDLPFGDLAMMLDLKPQGSVAAALSDPQILADPDLLQRQLCTGPAGVHVLAAPMGAGSQTPDSAQAGPLIQKLAGLFDFVVVDTAGGFGEFTAAALDVSDQALVVTTPEAPTLRRTELGLRQLASWKYPDHKIKVVLNRTNLKTGISEEDVTSILSQPVAWWLADEPAALQAAAVGEPLVLLHPKTELARTYQFMARQLAGLPEPQRLSLWDTLMRRRGSTLLRAA